MYALNNRSESYMLIETSGLSFVDISYEFDFDSEKTLAKFNEIYKGKFIKDTEQLKKDYPNFFDIKMDAETCITFTLKFNDFLTYCNMSMDDYGNLENKHQNRLPFPIKGIIKVKKNDKIFECKFGIRELNYDYIPITFPQNEIYLIKFTNGRVCIFKLLEDLTSKELAEYENFKFIWNNGINIVY